MSWNQENFSGYSFSEYSQPARPEPEAVGYTDPRFYQPRSEGAPRSMPVVQQPGQSFPVYTQDQRFATVDATVQMTEYTGPANLEGYTVDVGAAQQAAANHGSTATTNRMKERLAGLGGLGTAIALVAKFGVASITALISIGVYSFIFGWAFAIGLVTLLFLHETGHAIVMKLKGIPIGGMVFIPMLGAAVFMNRMPRNARDEAEVGIAGPVAGALAASVCLFIALANPYSPGVWASLAYFGFFMNLFNLIPVLPFDGGRVLAAIDRRIWIIGFLGLVAVQIWEWVSGTNSIWLLIFIVMAATQFFTRGGNTAEAQAYYTVPLRERILLGLAYFGLAAVLVLGMSMAHGLMPYSSTGF
jgi:Zn-dependent protease